MQAGGPSAADRASGTGQAGMTWCNASGSTLQRACFSSRGASLAGSSRPCTKASAGDQREALWVLRRRECGSKWRQRGSGGAGFDSGRPQQHPRSAPGCSLSTRAARGPWFRLWTRLTAPCTLSSPDCFRFPIVMMWGYRRRRRRKNGALTAISHVCASGFGLFAQFPTLAVCLEHPSHSRSSACQPLNGCEECEPGLCPSTSSTAHLVAPRSSPVSASDDAAAGRGAAGAASRKSPTLWRCLVTYRAAAAAAGAK